MQRHTCGYFYFLTSRPCTSPDNALVWFTPHFDFSLSLGSICPVSLIAKENLPSTPCPSFLVHSRAWQKRCLHTLLLALVPLSSSGHSGWISDPELPFLALPLWRSPVAHMLLNLSGTIRSPSDLPSESLTIQLPSAPSSVPLSC